MKTPEYIILTPTAPFKLYCLERFLKNVLSFKPRPKEMVFCIEPGMNSEISKWRKNLKNKGIKLVILELKQYLVKKFPGYNIKKLTYSREILRNYFVNSSFEWALWLDCDIIPEPNAAKVLFKIAQSEKFLAVCNQYLSRYTEGLILRGMGCTLTYKSACEFAKFQIIPFIWQKKEIGSLADDFWFLATLQAATSLIKRLIGHEGVKTGRFVSIWHMPEKGPDKFLKKIKN